MFQDLNFKKNLVPTQNYCQIRWRRMSGQDSGYRIVLLIDAAWVWLGTSQSHYVVSLDNFPLAFHPSHLCYKWVTVNCIKKADDLQNAQCPKGGGVEIAILERALSPFILQNQRHYTMPCVLFNFLTPVRLSSMTFTAIITVITTQMTLKRTCRAALSRKTRTVVYAGQGGLYIEW